MDKNLLWEYDCQLDICNSLMQTVNGYFAPPEMYTLNNKVYRQTYLLLLRWLLEALMFRKEGIDYKRRYFRLLNS